MAAVMQIHHIKGYKWVAVSLVAQHEHHICCCPHQHLLLILRNAVGG